MDIAVGVRLKRWRKWSGRTLEQLSDESGICVSSLHRMEHGTQELKSSDAAALARVYEISVADLYAFLPPPVKGLQRAPEFDPECG